MPTLVDVTSPDNLDDERWQAHMRAHARDQEVADKAAKDVKEALDKAALEVTGRLSEVRAYIDQVLKSHADLHGADREALILARDGIAKELREINNVREQIAAERAQYPTGDAVRALVSASRQETIASLTAHQVDERAEMALLREASKENSTRIGKLENDVKSALDTKKTVEESQRAIRDLEILMSNLNGRLVVAGGSLLVLVGALEWLIRGGKFG
jgi:hypothetical protein